MIYDCFTFFNELDLLEIRLNELNNVIDKFVLVEATFTHQGKNKPLYFNENKERFKAFEHKIIHIIVDKHPETTENSSWILERHQRNMISEGLKECVPEDIILVSDIDEIPNPEQIINYKAIGGIKIFRQKMFYYFLNCINASSLNMSTQKYTWNGSVMTFYKDMQSPQFLRNLSIKYLNLYSPRLVLRIFWRVYYYFQDLYLGNKIVFVNDGGWHFSYLGGVQKIIEKLESFAHSEYNTSEFKDAKNIEEAINNGKDIFGRGFSYRFVPIDHSFPKYIQANKQKFNEYIKEPK